MFEVARRRSPSLAVARRRSPSLPPSGKAPTWPEARPALCASGPETQIAEACLCSTASLHLSLQCLQVITGIGLDSICPQHPGSLTTFRQSRIFSGSRLNRLRSKSAPSPLGRRASSPAWKRPMGRKTLASSRGSSRLALELRSKTKVQEAKDCDTLRYSATDCYRLLK